MRCLPKIFLVLFLSYIGFVSAMEPASVPLRPIDIVFLNACANNKSIEFSIQQGANVNAINVKDNGYTGLCYACMFGNLAKVELLLKRGANVNQRSYDDLTPLYITFGVELEGVNLSASQRLEIGRVLINYGADVWAEGPQKTSVLSAAVRKSDINAVIMLIEKMKATRPKDWKTVDDICYDALGAAMLDGKMDICSWMLDQGIPVKGTKKNEDGVSLMHIVGKTGNPSIVRKLIDAGLDINTPDYNGKTALHYVAQEGTDGVRLLLDFGADPLIADINGKTPLDLAQKNPHAKIRMLMLEASRKKKKPSAQSVGLSEHTTKKGEKKEEVKKPLSRRERNRANKQESVVAQKATSNIEVPGGQAVKSSNQEMLPGVAKPEKSIPTSPREMESTQEETPNKFQKSSKNKFSLKSVGNYVRDEARDAVKNLTEKVEELSERVTNPIKENITPATLGKTYASMVGNQSEERQAQYVTVYDDNMTITVTIPPSMQNRFATMTPQDNPLAKIVSYSPHVEEKRQSGTDLYHNFSTHVEESLGIFADSKITKKATREHGPTIKYTIPARVTIFSEQPIYGAFEFTVRDGQMTHRFFKPDVKKKKKEKISFRLPASESDKDKSLLQ